MIALPSDVARANPEFQTAYLGLLLAMVNTFEAGLEGPVNRARQEALSIAALCVGGMVLCVPLPTRPG